MSIQEIIAGGGGLLIVLMTLVQIAPVRVKKNYDTWLAHTGVNGATITSTNYSGSYTIWQYSGVGKVGGISEKVDLNYCYVDYIGGTEAPVNTSAAKTYQVPKGITF